MNTTADTSHFAHRGVQTSPLLSTHVRALLHEDHGGPPSLVPARVQTSLNNARMSTLASRSRSPAAASLRTSLKSKPFIPRAAPIQTSPHSSYPIHPIHPASRTPAEVVKLVFDDPSQAQNTSRSVSLPIKLVDNVSFLVPEIATDRPRVVSLPEYIAFHKKIVVSSTPEQGPLADMLEARPLIDLSSPEQNLTINLPPTVQPSPTGTILIHSPYSRASSRTVSPAPSTPDDSGSENESVIFISDPVGLSPSFLRQSESRTTRIAAPPTSPAKTRVIRITSAQEAEKRKYLSIFASRIID